MNKFYLNDFKDELFKSLEKKITIGEFLYKYRKLVDITTSFRVVFYNVICAAVTFSPNYASCVCNYLCLEHV